MMSRKPDCEAARDPSDDMRQTIGVALLLIVLFIQMTMM